MPKGENGREDFILGLRATRDSGSFLTITPCLEGFYSGKIITVLQCMLQAQRVGLGNVRLVCPQSNPRITYQNQLGKSHAPRTRKKPQHLRMVLTMALCGVVFYMYERYNLCSNTECAYFP